VQLFNQDKTTNKKFERIIGSFNRCFHLLTITLEEFESIDKRIQKLLKRRNDRERLEAHVTEQYLT